MSDGDFHSRAARDEVSVAVDVVDARGLRPELVRASPFNRERTEIARVRAVPLLRGDDLRGVRGVLENVVLAVHLTVLNVADFTTNRDESVAESIELRLGLGLGRLNHQRTGDRPRHRRRVETVIHQALRDVRDFDAGGILDRAHVEDELVRARVVLAAEEHRVVILQALGHVVGVQDGALRRVRQTFGTHHSDVREGNR